MDHDTFDHIRLSTDLPVIPTSTQATLVPDGSAESSCDRQCNCAAGLPFLLRFIKKLGQQHRRGGILLDDGRGAMCCGPNTAPTDACDGSSESS